MARTQRYASNAAWISRSTGCRLNSSGHEQEGQTRRLLLGMRRNSFDSEDDFGMLLARDMPQAGQEKFIGFHFRSVVRWGLNPGRPNSQLKWGQTQCCFLCWFISSRMNTLAHKGMG